MSEKDEMPNVPSISSEDLVAMLRNRAHGFGQFNSLRAEYPKWRPYLFKVDLSELDLSELDLSDADLSGANLTRANLCATDLSGANLSGANLSRANLLDADLSGARTEEVQWWCANIAGAFGM